ncbi:MAG TPA: RES family NAD+ phosphorylase [Caulobacteraceae bacterium]
MGDRRARDLQLLDAIDALPRTQFEGTAWRIAREGRDALQGYPAGARWDPGTFDVLYTSLQREGSLAEIHFHLSRQPVFPSKLVCVLHTLTVRTRRVLKLADLTEAEALGVDKTRYGELAYERTQAIGDAAYFLGFDGLMVPSARWGCQNLILFTDQLFPEDLAIEESTTVDWAAWRSEADARRGHPIGD